MIESGQADLMLISYLGIDLQHEGDRIYRLLGCELTFGRISGAEQPWQILFSTLPAATGGLFSVPADPARWDALPVGWLGIYPPENGWRPTSLPRLQHLTTETLV